MNVAEQDQATLALKGENAALKNQVAQLTFQLEQLKRLIYGAKSERFVSADPGQATLFGVEVGTAPPPKRSATRAQKHKTSSSPCAKPSPRTCPAWWK